MHNFYKSQVKVIAGGGVFSKALVILFLLLTTFFLASCGGLMEEGVQSGYGRITINTPGSREVSFDEISRMTYKFYFNGEDYGSQNTAMFPVGTSLTIKIEGYVNGILRASKTDSPFTVQAGDNYRSIVISRSRDEVIPPVPATSVSYSKGTAAYGEVTGIPQSTAYEQGATFTVASAPTWEHGGVTYGTFTSWTASTELEPDGVGGQPTNSPTPGSDYIMPDSGVLLTANWNATQFSINYNTAIPTGVDLAPGTPQINTNGATSFTMASDDTDDALSTYTDTQNNWAFGGWSATNGGAINITSKADIRSAVVNGSLSINGNTINLYAVWTDARTPFTVTVNASALGLGTTTIPNVMNTQDITTQVTDFLTGNANSTVKYELKAGNTITANAAQPTVTLSDTNVTTKVAVTLGNQLIEASGSNLITDGAVTVTFTDPSSESATTGKWYTVGTALPTASLGGANAQQYAVGSGWRTTTGTAQTQITKDMAGQTLYPIAEQKVAVTVTSASNYTLGNGGANPFYVSKNTDITNQVKAFIPANTSSQRFTWKTSGNTTVNSGTGTAIPVNIDDYLDVENATNVDIKINGTTIGTVNNKFGGDTIVANDVTGFLSNSDVSNKRYGLTSANTNKTYTVTKGQTVLDITADVEVKAVKITLSGAAMGVGSGTFTVSIVGNDPHAGDINNAAWYNINESFPDVTVLRDGAPESGYEVSWGLAGSTTYTQIREDMAGQMLQAVLQIKQYTITIEHYKWVGSSWEKIDDSDVSGYDLNPAPPLPDPIDYGCEISSSLQMGMTAIRIEDQQGTVNQYSCDGNAALLSANGAAINDLPADGSATQISPGHTITSDITLYILWKQ